MEQNNAGSRGDRARCWQQGLGTPGTETPGGSEQLLPQHFGAASGLRHPVQRQHVGKSH